MTTLKKTMLSNTLLDRFTPLLIDTVINQFFLGNGLIIRYFVHLT